MTAPTPESAWPRPYPAKVTNSTDFRQAPFRTLAVEVPDHGRVTVRWRIKSNPAVWRWKCDLHGQSSDPDCLCAWSAAIALGEQLLGLTRLPTLDPTLNRSTTP